MGRGWFGFEDPLGPEQILHLWQEKLGLEAIVVVDNTACGVAIGGVRMAPDVTLEECFRLARAMTFKNAAAGLRHGGGKAVIRADPAMPAPEKERLVRGFARAIRDLEAYVPGPDMGTDETAMAWIRDEIGRSGYRASSAAFRSTRSAPRATGSRSPARSPAGTPGSRSRACAWRSRASARSAATPPAGSPNAAVGSSR